jgi:hypothetical protein
VALANAVAEAEIIRQATSVSVRISYLTTFDRIPGDVDVDGDVDVRFRKYL